MVAVPRWADAQKTLIDIQIIHDGKLVWTTVDKTDPRFSRAAAGVYGEIEPFEAPCASKEKLKHVARRAHDLAANTPIAVNVAGGFDFTFDAASSLALLSALASRNGGMVCGAALSDADAWAVHRSINERAERIGRMLQSVLARIDAGEITTIAQIEQEAFA